MPGSTSIFGSTAEDQEIAKNPEPMSAKQPPPVAPRTTSVQIQSWQSANSGGDNWHARSASMDSLESSGSSSSGGGSSSANAHPTTVEYIPTRTVGKIAKLPPHNPLQFVKVQSPLYKKEISSMRNCSSIPCDGLQLSAEQQIKLTKEVKITREALKEGEEEWQSNLDNWKSRRRKVSEKVIQRAEEMRQIEAEEQLRQDQYLQQQRKIKKFSEIVEKRSTSRYNLDLYIGQGNDSGLGGTPEPDDTIDCQSSILRSDTSEGMTSEAESIDSDIHKSDKVHEKEPPKVPQKPQMRLLKDKFSDEFNNSLTSANHFTTHHSARDFDNFSSAEPSDIEGHTGDSETVSSEEDISYIADSHKSELSINDICDQRQESYSSIKNGNINGNINSTKNEEIEETKKSLGEKTNGQPTDWQTFSFNISIKPGDNRGFGFTLKGGKDQGCAAYIDSVTKYSPADVAGLREGDKIISLNGELSSDYSHASLVFSIKQAVYAGILDIIISRSDKDAPLSSEIKKTTSRKSSFAEKLALFSSGVNSATSNLDESKSSPTSSKSGEGKGESLVLRRRSAFENGRKESNIVHRRSSCLSQGNSKVDSDSLEKRLSVDLSQCSLPENGSVKKGPPPPVPVKPKLKPKIFHDLNKVESTKSNGCSDLEYLNSNGSTQKSHTISSDITNHGDLLNEEFLSNKNDEEIHLENSRLENNSNEKSDESSCIMLNEEKDSSQSFSYPEYDKSEDLQSYNPEVLSDSQKFAVNVDVPTLNFKSIDISDPNISENSLPQYVDTFIPSDFNTAVLDIENEVEKEILSSEKAIESESFTSINFISSEPIFSGSYRSELDSPEESKEIDFESDIIKNEDYLVEQNSSVDNNLLPTDICYMPEEQEQCDLEDNNVTFDLAVNMNNVSLEDNCEGVENIVSNTEDYPLDDGNSSPVENTEENDDNQVNPSPLCLPLEKVDEDDVISASTTTSSETPDTETVIETLPSNLSPLPNDESNGEDSSKLLNSHDKETEYLTEAPVTEASAYDIAEANCSENSEYVDNFDNVPIQEDFTSNDAEIYESNESGYPADQDDEYCRELDESIDQITSLDVIDEIEQQLMHQLEQQGETYEEMDEDLTAQLEQDINKQWLYITDEAELLDDLTPRNLEPPREPPPPPPPEADASDKKLFTRTNSTKRIKKELWRRRSDFLGLDSPERIDVDKILPPPPALEEILKQEREQTQWLEKRLSLAETDISAPLYMNDSVGIEPQDFTQNEYSSDYYLEDNDGVSAISGDSNNEQWKEHGDQGIFESTELQYTSADMTIPPSAEENQKTNESPQHKAKQNLHNLGAAPKAKIMDSNKWITEKVTPLSKKSIEPVFRQTTYNQNYWLTQDDERKRSIQTSENLADRRYSMPPCQTSHPDVTVRTWGDREYEFQKQRPRSAVWNTSTVSGDIYDSYSHKQDIMRTHSFDSHGEVNCDSDILESEAHKCSCCGKGLCEGSAMGIEALRLYFHIQCFRCCVCRMQLGNGTCGTDVQVKNNQLYCPNCFTVD